MPMMTFDPVCDGIVLSVEPTKSGQGVMIHVQPMGAEPFSTYYKNEERPNLAAGNPVRCRFRFSKTGTKNMGTAEDSKWVDQYSRREYLILTPEQQRVGGAPEMRQPSKVAA